MHQIKKYFYFHLCKSLQKGIIKNPDYVGCSPTSWIILAAMSGKDIEWTLDILYIELEDDMTILIK